MRKGLYRLRHPLILASLCLLLLNDHYLKGSVYDGFVTGKLSDLSGLFFFPFFVADFVRLKKGQTLIFSIIALVTAVSFMLLKTSIDFRLFFLNVYEFFSLKATVAPDKTDLWTLLVLPIAVWFEKHKL